MTLLSIDPGKSGAAALFDERGSLLDTYKVKVPKGQRFFGWNEIQELKEFATGGPSTSGVAMVVMEGLLDFRMKHRSALAINTTAVNWGMQYSAGLDISLVPVRVVAPSQWKRAMELSKDKGLSIALARELVDPAFLRKGKMKVDNIDIAEAVLIGIYYGRKELGWTI